MTVIAITMIIIFLLGMLAFGSSVPVSVLGIIVSTVVVLLKLNLMPHMKITDKVKGFILNGLVILMFVLGGLTGMSSAEGGLIAYEVSLDSAMDLVEKDKLDEAWEEIDAIKEIYGMSDNTVALEVVAYLAEGSYDDALSALNGYSSKTSVDYYVLLESIYLVHGAQKNGDSLSRMYREAADFHPNWTYVQQMAGMAYISLSEFTRAEYHLLRAYEQEPSDYKTPYYLGVASYEQRRMEEALGFFQESLDREADDETQSYIAWYIQEIGK